MNRENWFIRENRKDEVSIQKKVDEVMKLIETDKLKDSVDILKDILKEDFENEGVSTLLKYLSFWKKRMEYSYKITNPIELGDYFVNQWFLFLEFIKNIRFRDEFYFFAIKKYVFNKALSGYKILLKENGRDNDPNLLIKVGRCLKNKGNYERACDFFKEALSLERNNALVLAELADCLSILDEEDKAKLFFKEAFFIDPSKIDLKFLESALICRLYEKVLKETCVEERAGLALEWMPVFGVLWGIFSIKRELKPMEYSKLINSIRVLEKDYASSKKDAEKNLHKGNLEYEPVDRIKFIVPRLLNKYFWLVDHYLNKEENSKIDEVLLKIKTIDSKIYYIYTK